MPGVLIGFILEGVLRMALRIPLPCDLVGSIRSLVGCSSAGVLNIQRGVPPYRPYACLSRLVLGVRSTERSVKLYAR